MNLLFYISGYDGCGYYRVELPVRYLNTLPDVHAKIRSVYSKKDLEWADVVILQKQVNDKVVPYVEYAKSIGKKVVTEVDDDYFNIPIWNPARSHYVGREDDLSRFYKQSDGMTVTTKYLKGQLSKYNDNIEVIPNYFDFSYIDREFKGLTEEQMISNTVFIDKDRSVLDRSEVYKKLNDSIVIGWGGSPTHLRDLEQATASLVRIINEFENVSIVMMACATDSLINQVPKDRLFLVNPVPTFLYYKVLASMKFDISICPIEDNTFNRSKSNLKFLEFSANKFPTICSKVENYANTVEDRVTGLLTENTDESWYENLYELVTNEDLRAHIAKNAYEFVRDEYCLEKNFTKWSDYYKTLLG